MTDSAFVEISFFALTVLSLILPIGIYAYLMWAKAISHKTVPRFSILLIAISGVNVVLLQRLSVIVKASPYFDNGIFASEVSLALFLLPALFAGIGVNMMSHTLIKHINEAEKRFDEEHKTKPVD
jgi:hypothetical protein